MASDSVIIFAIQHRVCATVSHGITQEWLCKLGYSFFMLYKM